MAKKKKNELTYLQLPIPEGRKYYKMAKRSWSGLNKKQTIDTGALSMEKNISTVEAPYLTPSEKRKEYVLGYWRESKDGEKVPLSIHGFEDSLLVVYYEPSNVWIDYITEDEEGNQTKYTGLLNSNATQYDKVVPRSIVQFNKYVESEDIVNGQYIKKLLIFPDKASMPMRIVETEVNPDSLKDKNADWSTLNDNELYYYQDTGKFFYVDIATKTVYLSGEIKNDGNPAYFACDGLDVTIKVFNPSEENELPPDSANKNYCYQDSESKKIYVWDKKSKQWQNYVPPIFPDIKYAAVHLSRLFGVSDDKVYASGFNDYTNWALDTADEYNESNAWCSQAQSNTKAGGNFTGITAFQNHVICFKRDFMHEVYNTKNPFRIQDIYAEGAIDNRTIQDVDGRLIFVSNDNVKIYTGSDPRIISYPLNVDRYEYAVSGTDGRNYYLYCDDGKGYNPKIFVYDTFFNEWSEQEPEKDDKGYVRFLGFAHNKNGMYALGENGVVYKLDTGDYNHEWSFETDLITNETIDIKHLKKIQMLADIAKGANIKVYVLYDDEEFNPNSHLVYSSTDYGRTTIRVKPRKTAHYGIKLHVEGYGYVKLYELELALETGGDLYV